MLREAAKELMATQVAVNTSKQLEEDYSNGDVEMSDNEEVAVSKA